MTKPLILGTSYLGDKYSSSEFLQMYDVFAEHGFYMIDTAINYPISGNPRDFLVAMKILCQATLPKRSVYIKVGGCQNTGGPQTLLGEAYLRFICELIQENFQDSLFGIGVHWDNREEFQQVSETLHTLDFFQNLGLVTGFSGVKEFAAYDSFLESKQKPYVVQHNLRDLSSIQSTNYSMNWVYGLANIRKLSPTLVHQISKTLLEEERVNAIMIGPTNVEQLKDWLEVLSERR